MRIAGIGHAVFAATLIALGLWGLVTGEFGAIWQPVPKGVPARDVLAYLCALVALTTGVGLLWRGAAALAAGVLLAYLLIWFMAFKAPEIWRAPAVVVSWEDCAESVVVVAGAWALFAQFAAGRDRRRLALVTGETGVRIARTLYGLSMVVFGLAHFAYVKLTASLVPGWLPSHLAWAYLTGGAYIAAGAAMLLGVFARLASALSVLQMGLFTLLVWAPMLVAGSRDASVWNEAVISWTLTAAGWVVADTYRGASWLAMRKR
jgi:uncharacterized membrane protein